MDIFLTLEKSSKKEKIGIILFWIQINKIIIGVLSIVSICLILTDNAIFISRANYYINDYVNNNKITTITNEIYEKFTKVDINIGDNILRCINITISFIIVLVIIVKYRLIYTKQFALHFISSSDSILKWKELYQCILECCIGVILSSFRSSLALD